VGRLAAAVRGGSFTFAVVDVKIRRISRAADASIRWLAVGSLTLRLRLSSEWSRLRFRINSLPTVGH